MRPGHPPTSEAPQTCGCLTSHSYNRQTRLSAQRWLHRAFCVYVSMQTWAKLSLQWSWTKHDITYISNIAKLTTNCNSSKMTAAAVTLVTTERTRLWGLTWVWHCWSPPDSPGTWRSCGRSSAGGRGRTSQLSPRPTTHNTYRLTQGLQHTTLIDLHRAYNTQHL